MARKKQSALDRLLSDEAWLREATRRVFGTAVVVETSEDDLTPAERATPSGRAPAQAAEEIEPQRYRRTRPGRG